VQEYTQKNLSAFNEFLEQNPVQSKTLDSAKFSQININLSGKAFSVNYYDDDDDLSQFSLVSELDKKLAFTLI